MADNDIDIEEHDVFENPVIKNIFPDISIVKKEISQYFEDGHFIKEESIVTDTSSENIIPSILETEHKPILTNDPIHQTQLSVLDSVLTNTASTDNTTGQMILPVAQDCKKSCLQINSETFTDICDEHVSNILNKVDTTLQSNNIIIAFKPNTTNNEINDIKRAHTKEAVVRLPKVVLQDIGSYIYRNNRYCQDCFTLFPSKPAYDNHKNIKHSVERHSSQVRLIMIQKKDKHKCALCDTFLSSSSNLCRHKRNIHKIKETPSEFQCTICKNSFSYRYNLIRHYRNVHKKNVIFNSKYKRNKTKSMQDSQKSNFTISTLKRNMQSQKRLESTDSQMAASLCFHCKKPFPNQKSLIDHIYKVLELKQSSEVSMEVGKLQKMLAIEQSKGQSESKTATNGKQGLELCHTKPFRDKLVFENGESFESGITFSGVREVNNSIDLNDINILPQQKVIVSKNTPLKPVHINKLVTSDEIEDIGSSGSRYLRNKRNNQKYAYNDLEESAFLLPSKEQKKLKSSDISPSESLKKKQKLESHNANSNTRSKYLNIKEKNRNGNLNLQKPKTTNNKHTTDLDYVNKITTTDSEHYVFKGKIQSKGKCIRKLKNKFIYECIYCSYIAQTVRSYDTHVTEKHNIKIISRVKRVVFDKQCKYCPFISINESSHNKHLFAYHYDLLNKDVSHEVVSEDGNKNDEVNVTESTAFKQFKSFVLKSVIYKCNRCDIHFLSSYIAKDHDKHMELLVNWKCSICHRIFKKHDKYLHFKQHKFSKSLNVYQFNETELSTLLYNCTKCAIHFTEDRYIKHYPSCEIETADSVYCKTCDMLIDKYGYENHIGYHKKGKDASYFTVITADIITKKGKRNTTPTRKKVCHQVNCLTFCLTCKCYLSDLERTHKTHVESRCSKIPKYICNLCGLVFTHVAMRTHRQHHKIKSHLKVHDFKFFNLKGIQIIPPLPEYPRCNNCEVHFLNKNAIKNHHCSEVDYLTCHVCNTKLSEDSYILHMNFHSYSIQKTHRHTKSQVAVTFELRHLEKIKDESVKPKIHETLNSSKISLPDSQSQECSDTDSRDDNFRNILYCCQPCKIAVDTYDKVIIHCQNHYNPTPKKHATLKVCTECSFKIESEEYENHYTLHVLNVAIVCLPYDPAFFILDNNVWKRHLFASVSQNVKEKIVAKSIYQHECRLKMEIVQKGISNLILYKCDKCTNFIDPNCILAHLKEPCLKMRQHPCSVCGLPFMSLAFRMKHENIHRQLNFRIKSMNIVLIKCEGHKVYNNVILKAIEQYFLYQCRTCNGIVNKLQRKTHHCNIDDLKECSKCKLLFYNDDFDSHVLKHVNIPKFKGENMKIILFGGQNKVTKKLSPGFCGMVYDYMLHICAKCEVCQISEVATLRHVCITDNSQKWKCYKCGLYIANSDQKSHISMHDLDSEYNIENINVIPFDFTEDNTNVFVHKEKALDLADNENANTSECKQDVNVQNIAGEQNLNIVNNDQNKDVLLKESVILYRCDCGLHFINKLIGQTHLRNCNPKVKMVRQSCSKCGLLFNTKELFSHVLAHHGKKTKTYEFQILDLSLEGEVLTLYQCLICKLHFSETVRKLHNNCNRNNNVSEKCDKCNLFFDKSSLRESNHTNETCKNNYTIITFNESLNISTEEKSSKAENILPAESGFIVNVESQNIS